jgi:NSS family neurotransmitter:Na+ symporter
MFIGRVMGAIFFLAMSFAALTSMIATIEIAARNFVDMGWERNKAVKYICVAIALCGLPSAYSLEFLDNQDFVWGTGLIVSGLMVAVVVMKFGTSEFRETFINTEYSDLYIGKWWEYIIRYAFPVEFALVFGFFIYEKLQDSSSSPIGGMDLGLFTILTMVVQWLIIISLFAFGFNDRVADKIKAGPLTVAEAEEV